MSNKSKRFVFNIVSCFPSTLYLAGHLFDNIHFVEISLRNSHCFKPATATDTSTKKLL